MGFPPGLRAPTAKSILLTNHVYIANYLRLHADPLMLTLPWNQAFITTKQVYFVHQTNEEGLPTEFT
jgi:hypothetical protein